MKNTGSRDTFLLFLVLLLAIGAVCYLCVIKKNLDEVSEVRDELTLVEQEKAKNDAIIQQAEELNQKREELKNQIQTVENKLLPDLNTSMIERKIYKHFEDANIPFIVKVSNTPLNYDTVVLPDGKTSPNHVKSSSYTVEVSGTDGFLLTHDEGDDLGWKVFYNQLNIPIGDANAVNPEAQALGLKSANEIVSGTYVGYDEFVAALKAIQADAPDYVKITNIKVDDAEQGFCTFSASVDVFSFELVDRLSAAPKGMKYMDWVGAESIATGGLVGIPSYFVLGTPNYKVSPSSPLYGRYLSFISYDFGVNRPFAAWNHWGYEWLHFDALMKDLSKLPPDLRSIELRYNMGMISAEEYNQLIQAYMNQNNNNTAPADQTAPTT